MFYAFARFLLKWLLLILDGIFEGVLGFMNWELALEHLKYSYIVMGSPEEKDSEASAFRNCLN